MNNPRVHRHSSILEVCRVARGLLGGTNAWLIESNALLEWTRRYDDRFAEKWLCDTRRYLLAWLRFVTMPGDQKKTLACRISLSSFITTEPLLRSPPSPFENQFEIRDAAYFRPIGRSQKRPQNRGSTQLGSLARFALFGQITFLRTVRRRCVSRLTI